MAIVKLSSMSMPNSVVVETPYNDLNDRFLVSLVSSYGNTSDEVTSPQEAAAAALSLVFDKDSDETIWCVLDRADGSVYYVDQEDAQEIMTDRHLGG